MTIKRLIEEIGSKRMLRIEKWRDEFNHWRAGIEWYAEDRYEFVCEYPTLKDCLLSIKDYLDKKQNGVK